MLCGAVSLFVERIFVQSIFLFNEYSGNGVKHLFYLVIWTFSMGCLTVFRSSPCAAAERASLGSDNTGSTIELSEPGR